MTLRCLRCDQETDWQRGHAGLCQTCDDEAWERRSRAYDLRRERDEREAAKKRHPSIAHRSHWVLVPGNLGREDEWRRAR